MKRRSSPCLKETTVAAVFCCSLFFLGSGAAGLVYEVIWVRLIDKVIGSAPFAVATVLSVFMAGLALGRILLQADTSTGSSTRSSLLAIYGGLELGIGIFALAVPFVINGFKPVYRLLYDRLLDHFWCYEAAAVTGCALILIIPTAFMGATLPVLCRFYINRLDHVGGRTGWLYGLNTIGGVNRGCTVRIFISSGTLEYGSPWECLQG